MLANVSDTEIGWYIHCNLASTFTFVHVIVLIRQIFDFLGELIFDPTEFHMWIYFHLNFIAKYFYIAFIFFLHSKGRRPYLTKGTIPYEMFRML